MTNIYLITGYSNNNIDRPINEHVYADNESSAIQIVQEKYGFGKYTAKQVSGKMKG